MGKRNKIFKSGLNLKNKLKSQKNQKDSSFSKKNEKKTNKKQNDEENFDQIDEFNDNSNLNQTNTISSLRHRRIKHKTTLSRGQRKRQMVKEKVQRKYFSFL